MRPAANRQLAALGRHGLSESREGGAGSLFRGRSRPEGHHGDIISPGACDDSVLSGLPPQVFQMIKDWHESGWTPMRRLGQPADVGNAVVLLCTDQASFITGQLLYVDGGASAMEPVFPLAIQGIK